MKNYECRATGHHDAQDERESQPHNMDAIVVGMGALGLMLAKRLTHFGQSVAVIEQSQTIADGPSIKNHGWLHTGVVHSLSSKDATNSNLVKKLQYGHRFYTDYASECIDEPFEKTYAITNDPSLAATAKERWSQLDVPFQELSTIEFNDIEPNMDSGAAQYFLRQEIVESTTVCCSQSYWQTYIDAEQPF